MVDRFTHKPMQRVSNIEKLESWIAAYVILSYSMKCCRSLVFQLYWFPPTNKIDSHDITGKS